MTLTRRDIFYPHSRGKEVNMRHINKEWSVDSVPLRASTFLVQQQTRISGNKWGQHCTKHTQREVGGWICSWEKWKSVLSADPTEFRNQEFMVVPACSIEWSRGSKFFMRSKNKCILSVRKSWMDVFDGTGHWIFQDITIGNDKGLSGFPEWSLT